MRRLFFAGCLALFGSLSLVRLHAAPPAKSADSRSAMPVYLEYVPFYWINELAYDRQHYADALHNAIRIGLDQAQAGDTRKDILRLTSPEDIQMLRALLKDPHCTIQAQGFYDTRFMLEADGGETQIFVDKEGVVSSGSQSWRLTAGDFARLRQVLDRVYAAPKNAK